MDTDSFLHDCDALMTGLSPVEIWSGVCETLSDPNSWCQGAKAMDATGCMVRPMDPDAVFFSIEGAVAYHSNLVGVVPPYMLRLLDQYVLDFLNIGEPAGIWNEHDIGWFNDYATHDTVVRYLDYVRSRLDAPAP